MKMFLQCKVGEEKKKGLGVGPVLKRKKEETNVINMHEEIKLFNL